MSAPVLKTVSLTKDFSGVRVLNGVSVEVRKGEVFGIIGENGAGKSTFIKIIGGIHRPSGGEIYLEGVKREMRTPYMARQCGVSLIPQEFNLIDSMTVFENVFLGEELRRGLLLDKKRMRAECEAMFAKLDAPVPVNAEVLGLSVAQKQMVEIAKALIHDSKILIMDEPTTVMTAREIDTLFDLMNNLKSRGTAVLYISHKLKEIKTICDRVLILRDGEMIETAQVTDINEHEMALKMVGRELTRIFPEKNEAGRETVMEVERLSSGNALRDVSFTLRRGEILGFAGLVGAGRTELAETIIGIRKKTSGALRLKGRRVSIGSPREAFRRKIAYLSEDRQGKGLFLDFDIPANITMISLEKYLNPFIAKARTWAKACEYVSEFNIRASSLFARLRYLSGGNQQKVYLAKCMDASPEILILDEPTRGIDVSAKQEIYRFIGALAGKGISCMVISSEMEELIGLCKRVLVMREGRITGELEGRNINEQEIMRCASGVSAKSA